MKTRKVLSQALMGALFAGGSLAIFNSQASADTHVVTRQGETIDSLARAYESTPDQIKQKNGLTNVNADDQLAAGQALDIPNARPDEWVGVDRSTADVDPLVIANQIQQANNNVNQNLNNDVQNFSQVDYQTNNNNQVNNNYSNNYNSGYTQVSAPVVNTSYQGTTNYSSNNGASYNAVTSDNINQGNVSASYSSNQAVQRARSQLGVPYVWGGENPGHGFDCSGLAQWAEGLPAYYRTTYQQQALGQHHYDVQNAQAGDLYFWGSDNAPYHVAVAEGNGNYIQAPQPGQSVQEQNINYYRPNFYVSMQNR